MNGNDKTAEWTLEWEQASISDYHNIDSFLHSLGYFKKEPIGEQAGKIASDVFKSYDCLTCAACCKNSPPIFTSKDIKRISKFLKVTPKYFIKKYLIRDIDGSYLGKSVPCLFLNQDNRCSIYEVRPKACSEYPHLADGSLVSRPKFNLENTKRCPIAYQIVKKLKEKLA